MIKGDPPSYGVHDEVYIPDGHTDDKHMLIDQRGRIVQRQEVDPPHYGCVSRCKKCIYYSPVGYLAWGMGKHCKYPKQGPTDTDKLCGMSIFVAVHD